MQLSVTVMVTLTVIEQIKNDTADCSEASFRELYNIQQMTQNPYLDVLKKVVAGSQNKHRAAFEFSPLVGGCLWYTYTVERTS